MGDSKALATLVALCVGASSLGCALIQLHLRTPGERLKTFPEPVAEEYHCDKRPLPFFEVEANELLPTRVKPGSEFNHRMVYVMCPRNPTAVIAGNLRTRILYKGKAIFHEDLSHELKPGRWVVDTFIPLPKAAQPGIYALEITFESRKGNFQQHATFAVETP